jgi:trimeric autotransporter adhesin
MKSLSCCAAWSCCGRRLRRLVLLGGLLLAVASPSLAQTFTGGLRGAVREAGGIIPGVTVELINEANGASREATTNSNGEYNFAAVTPGTYTVRAALTGFKTYESKGVRIGTQQFITLDVVLEVGTVQETITVTGAAPLIDTSNASTGATISQQELSALPSGGRAAFLFAVTVPTVVASGDGQYNRQQDQTNAALLSLGGGTRRGNNYLLDGVSITDMRNRATANPTMESVEDVGIQVHTYDAETGRTGGGTFNVTAKSGNNAWHGSGLYQLRPKWGSANNYFSELAGQPKPNTYYHLGGGSFGGPIVRNRTFFWFATEGYGTNETRGGSLRLPTSRERRGDFSQSFDSQGRLVTIYDPLTGNPDGTGRTPFAGNIIPPDRINPVSGNVTNFLPSPDVDVSNGSNNFTRTAELVNRAIMYTGKVDHRITDDVALTGYYLYNRSNEPCADYWEPGLNGANRFADPGDYILQRRVNVLALNNTWIPGNNTVVTLRYGYTRFIDTDVTSIDFDPSSLGFSPAFTSGLQVPKFPQVRMTDYNSSDYTRVAGAIDPTDRNWHSWGVNGALTKLVGRHTLKFGADFRWIGLDFQSFEDTSGDFRFDRSTTGANPLINGVDGANPSGNAFASFLLGYPSGLVGEESRVGLSNPLQVFTKYYGFYAQDDFRASQKLTFNYGIRLEHEDGLREAEDRFTVGFDRTLVPSGPLGNVVVNGSPVRGGLIYAGQDGANDYQGNPPGIKVSPRLGVVYSFNPKTVVRAGYGIYWAPWNYPAPNITNYGQVGFNNATLIQQSAGRPSVNFTNPFPNGFSQPIGNGLGGLTGVGTQIEFIDQEKKAPYVHQYSVDVMRELPNNLAVGFEYVGAKGVDLGLGGSNDARININQLDPSLAALGSALTEAVPNPFFGLPRGQGFNVTSPTITRAQSLRPFPQFGDIYMRQSTLGRNNYNAAVFKLEKRMSNGWGGRINYTFSRLKDNQFGEGNFFSRNSTEAANAYDIEGEYSIGILDVPHKVSVAPMFELPFGEGRRWMTSGVGAAVLGDWTVSSIITLESGFPVSLSTSSNRTANLFTLMSRANPGTGDAETDGSRDERIQGQWLDPAAYTQPALFSFGTLPRNLDDVRTPTRHNWDFVASKDFRFGGSMRGQFRFEMINVTNTVKVRGPISTVGSSTFGQIRVQSGFMRITQLMFRLTF